MVLGTFGLGLHEWQVLKNAWTDASLCSGWNQKSLFLFPFQSNQSHSFHFDAKLWWIRWSQVIIIISSRSLLGWNQSKSEMPLKIDSCTMLGRQDRACCARSFQILKRLSLMATVSLTATFFAGDPVLPIMRSHCMRGPSVADNEITLYEGCLKDLKNLKKIIPLYPKNVLEKSYRG